ncbi:MAG TPA: hypothetical protein VM120_25965 [Bryobacteraceae bacterium]|nr:hypothetical protein [Bryobacteraceae bacterium]
MKFRGILPFSAVLCLAFASPRPARAQSGPALKGTAPQGPFTYALRSSQRCPGLVNPQCGIVGGPAVASASCDSQSGREWEGISATDYFTFTPNVYSPPNPDIAVGPDDILTVVNRTIARYPNPNAPLFNNLDGTAAVPYDTVDTFFYAPTSRQFLDVCSEKRLSTKCAPPFPARISVA